MMYRKRRILSLSLLVLALIIGTFLFFFPRTYHYQVNVPYTMNKAAEQFNDAGNLSKWYFPFSSVDTETKQIVKQNEVIRMNDYSLAIKDPEPLSAELIAGYKNSSRTFLFTAISDTSDMDASTIHLIYKSSLINHLLDKGDLEKNARQSLENLQLFMEDTRNFYGYSIERTTVTDTLFLFKSAIVPAECKREETKQIFEELINYAEKRKAGYNGVRIFYSTNHSDNKVMLFASIGITKLIETNPDELFQVKRMPFGKNLLMANYQGPYGGVNKVYTALENFKSDHKLSSMAIPYQKFLSEGYDFADDEIVQMKVYYPVF